MIRKLAQTNSLRYKIGGAEGDRTPGLRIANEALLFLLTDDMTEVAAIAILRALYTFLYGA